MYNPQTKKTPTGETNEWLAGKPTMNEDIFPI